MNKILKQKRLFHLASKFSLFSPKSLAACLSAVSFIHSHVSLSYLMVLYTIHTVMFPKYI